MRENKPCLPLRCQELVRPPEVNTGTDQKGLLPHHNTDDDYDDGDDDDDDNNGHVLGW